MGLKNFAISIVKSLIIFLLVSLIFSAVTLDVPSLMKNVFGDIFAYASPDAQKQAVGKLAETCSSLDKGESIVTINQICTNISLLDSMRENCANYRELKRRGARIENEGQVKETCRQIESGELERACSEIEGKSSLLPDFSNIGSLCKDYKSGKIDDKEFFFNVVGNALPGQQSGMQTGVLGNYNQLMNYLNSNRVIYFLVLSVLVVILYLLLMDFGLFLAVLSQISFSIGILIMLPYFAILAYDKFVGIDTTPILGSMFGNGAMFDPKAIISLIILLFLRTYTGFIVTLGIAFLAAGVAGRIYGFVLRGKSKEKMVEVKETKPRKKKKSKTS